MHRLARAFITLVLIALAIASASVALASSSSVGGVKILFPRIGSPEACTPGSTVTLAVESQTSISNATIYLIGPHGLYKLNYTIFNSSNSIYKVRAYIPKNVVEGVYDLVIRSKGAEAHAFKCIVVFKTWPKMLRIAHITDAHVGVINSNGKPAYTYLLTELVDAELMHANVIVMTGDNVDVGGDVGYYQELLNALKTIALPTIICPGNHEYAGDSDLRNYHAFIGPSNYYLRWGPYLFIMMDSGSNGLLSNDQLSWLEGVLKENSNAKVKIICFHHPIFRAKVVGYINTPPSRISEIKNLLYYSWASAPELASKLLSIVLKYNVTLVLSGHVHADGLVVYMNKTLFVTTTATGGPVRAGDYHGFRIIDVYSNGTVIVHGCLKCSILSPHASISSENSITSLRVGGGVVALYYRCFGEPEVPEYSGGASSIALRVYNVVDGKLYVYNSSINIYNTSVYGNQFVKMVVVNVKPSKSFSISIVYSNKTDTEAPVIKFYEVSPEKPIAGRDRVEVTFKAFDKGWGISVLKAYCKLPSGKEIELPVYPMGSGYYSVKLPIVESRTATLEVTAVDYAGHVKTSSINITYATPTKTVSPSSKTTVKATSKSIGGAGVHLSYTYLTAIAVVAAVVIAGAALTIYRGRRV